MAYESKEKYVTELGDYCGPADRISPYHFYQNAYWQLRRYWRRKLYDWTRRPACDASISISPDQVVAGERATVTLTLKAGKKTLPEHSRIAVYFQMVYGGVHNRSVLTCFQGPDGQTGYGSRITANTDRKDVELEVIVHSTGSIFTCVEVVLAKGELTRGEQLNIVIGDPSCKPPVVCEQAKTLPFRVAVDYSGERDFFSVLPNPEVRIVGSKAYYLRCFADPTPAIGEEFSVRVVAADLENHNPSFGHCGKLRLTASEGSLVKEVTSDMPQDAHGTMLVKGLKTDTSDVTRIQVIDTENSLMGQVNPICPGAAPKGLRLYYGEIHSHTELSDGTGTPENNYTWARDVEGLDFSALADHFEDGQSYNYTLEDKWRITKEVTEKFNDPGRFVTLLGYEIGTVEKHRNVYFSDQEGRMIVEGPKGETVSMDNVFEKLEGTNYILIPHAPKFHGIDWNAPHNVDRQRLVEICSTWGISEEGGPLSVRQALNMGYKFGFTGGTDNHSAEPGNPSWGGITGVFAQKLDRKSLFESLLSRRTFATSGSRMILNFNVNDSIMGQELKLGASDKPHITGRAITSEPIEKMEIIRNGQPVFERSGGGRKDLELDWQEPNELRDLVQQRSLLNEKNVYYYLRVTTVNKIFGWASPVWVIEG